MRRLLFIVAALFSVSVSASEFYEQNPSEIKTTFASARPVGTGVLRELMLRAYEAGFWSKSGAWNPKEPYALSLTYFWEIEAADIVERTMKEMRHVRPRLSVEDRDGYEALLRGVIPDVRDGDRITALWLPNTRETVFTHNGKKTGAIKGAGFADAFFAIWLDANTTAPELRAKLLNK